MALQTSGAISLLNIATEFGGTSPHSLSEYYRGGGLVPNTPANTNVPTSGVISLSNFYGASASSGSIVNPLPGNGSTYSSSDDISSQVYLYVNTDGIMQVNTTSAGTTTIGNWFTPTTTGIGNSYWVRFVLNSTSGSSTNTSWTTTTGWLQLSSQRSCFVSAFTSGPSNRSRTANYTVQIATDSGGTNIVTSGTYTLQCTAIYNPV